MVSPTVCLNSLLAWSAYGLSLAKPESDTNSLIHNVSSTEELGINDTTNDDQKVSSDWGDSNCFALIFSSDIIISVHLTSAYPPEVTRTFFRQSLKTYSNCPKYSSSPINSPRFPRSVSETKDGMNEIETLILQIAIGVKPIDDETDDLPVYLRISFGVDPIKKEYSLHSVFIGGIHRDIIYTDDKQMTSVGRAPTSAPIGTYSSCNETTWKTETYDYKYYVEAKLRNVYFRMDLANLNLVENKDNIDNSDNAQETPRDVCIPKNSTDEEHHNEFLQPDDDSTQMWSISWFWFTIAVVIGGGILIILLIFGLIYHLRFTRMRGIRVVQNGSSGSITDKF